MKTFLRSAAFVFAFAGSAALACPAQMSMPAGPGATPKTPKKLLSPPAQAETTLAGKTLTVHYNSPRMRGRKIMGGLVPYGKVWRTGADPATTFITPIDLKIGDLSVPAGTYTLFTLPSAAQWKLIVSKKTGEWGIPYPEGFDLGRTPMHRATLPAPQQDMTISFEKTMADSTQLHVKWETTDVWVTIRAVK